jgi:Tripartite tricarboxylate transporter TctB family
VLTLPSANQPHGAKPLDQDLVGGLFVAALAAVAIVKSNDLDIGTVAEIGPGLFPAALGALLLALSLVLVAKALVLGRGNALVVPGRRSARALSGILGALVLFGLTVRGIQLGPLALPALGLAGATPLAILAAGAADPETRWPGLLVFAIALTLFCVLLFRFALGLSVPLAPFLVGY